MKKLDEILKKLRKEKSELDWIEVKSAKKGVPEKLYKSLSALTNREDGGYMLFGVSDAPNFIITGVSDLDKLQSVLANMSRNEMEPPIDLQMETETIKNKVILLTRVPETLYYQKPCYYKPAGIVNGSYIRVGDGDRHLTEYEVLTLLANHKKALDDTKIVEEAKDFSKSKYIYDYIDLLIKENPTASFLKGKKEEIKERLGLTKKSFPSLASVLCLSPYPQQYFSSLTVHFLQPSIDKENVRYLDNKKFEGNIPEIINRASNYILSKLSQRTIIEGTERRDRYEISEVIIREVVRNALIHRDYSERACGTPVQVFMHNDKLEFINPGGLYGPVSTKNLVNSLSTRNALIVKILEDLKIVENRGGGIDEILKSCKEYNLEPPKFINEISSFKVIIYREERVQDEEKSINTFLKDNKSFSTKNVMEYFKISRTNAIEYVIRKMLKQNLVERKGKGRGTKYYRI